MSNGADNLPLFTRKQPECRLIPFPMVNRMGRIRDTASKMLDKPTEKSAEHYRRLVDEAVTAQLEKIGLSEKEIQTEREAFWKAVDLEISRLSYK
jgi:vacuolar-type H+-ATPase subunit H